jgi:hypothetical protein
VETKEAGEAMIETELGRITNMKVLGKTRENLIAIGNGTRDFRF